MQQQQQPKQPRYKPGDRVHDGRRVGVIVRVQQTYDGGYFYYVQLDDGGGRLQREAHLQPHVSNP